MIFELWAGHMPDFRGAGSPAVPLPYDACILRYFAAIAVGMWLAIDDARVGRRRLVVVALAVPSVAYIAVAGTDPASLPFFVHGFTLATNFAAVPWAAAMLLAALHLWPAHSVPGTGWLERLGVASFESSSCRSCGSACCPSAVRSPSSSPWSGAASWAWRCIAC